MLCNKPSLITGAGSNSFLWSLGLHGPTGQFLSNWHLSGDPISVVSLRWPQGPWPDKQCGSSAWPLSAWPLSTWHFIVQAPGPLHTAVLSCKEIQGSEGQVFRTPSLDRRHLTSSTFCGPGSHRPAESRKWGTSSTSLGRTTGAHRRGQNSLGCLGITLHGCFSGGADTQYKAPGL